jgi:hypothetical protein
MKANILGFWWEVGDAIPLADLFAYLKGIDEEKYAGHNRLLFIGETDKYHTGLFLTSKTHKKFCELKKSGQTHKINVRKAEAGASLIDFNFFLVHKLTGRGLYQFYHHSCHPKVFTRFCVRQFGALRDERRAAEIVAAGGDSLSDRARDRIERKYEQPIQWQMLVRREKFAAIVKQLQSIGGFEFYLNSVEAEKEKRFSGFRGISQRIRHRVTFSRDVSPTQRAKAILNFVKGNSELGNAAVDGKDSDGLDKVIALHDNPDSFGNYDFDKLAENMDFEPEKFEDSVFMSELIRVADTHAHVLNSPTQ